MRRDDGSCEWRPVRSSNDANNIAIAVWGKGGSVSALWKTMWISHREDHATSATGELDAVTRVRLHRREIEAEF